MWSYFLFFFAVSIRIIIHGLYFACHRNVNSILHSLSTFIFWRFNPYDRVSLSSVAIICCVAWKLFNRLPKSSTSAIVLFQHFRFLKSPKNTFFHSKRLFLSLKKTFLSLKKTFLSFRKTFLWFKKTSFFDWQD